VIAIETVTTLLIAAAVFVAVCLIGPKLIRVWKGEKTHHRQLEADRKAKEEDFPD
jgi:hypothetical protein